MEPERIERTGVLQTIDGCKAVTPPKRTPPYITRKQGTIYRAPTNSIQGGDGGAFGAATVQIAHGDVEENVATRRLNANDKRFGVRAAGKAGFVHVHFGRKHFEMKALVVEQRDGIADDHVGELANGFAHDLLAGFHLRACEDAGDLHGDFGRNVENHAAFNVAFDANQRGHALAAVGVFVHLDVDDFCGPLQGLGKNRVRRIDKRLDQFHSHDRLSPTSAVGAPEAFGSSLSTYRRISYNTSGLTGFCTKCLAPFWSAARMFSWYPTEDTMTMRASECWRTMRSTASMPSICGMVMSMSTMSGLMRLNSAMAVRPSPASPASSPPNISIILMRFLRAKTESSTTR